MKMHSKEDTMRKISKSIASTLLALTLTTTIAWAGKEKLSSDLNLPDSPADVEVIVQYKVAPTEAHHRKIGQLGGRLHGKMDHIKAGHIRFRLQLSRVCRRTRMWPSSRRTVRCMA